jgi:hypothetical protein
MKGHTPSSSDVSIMSPPRKCLVRKALKRHNMKIKMKRGGNVNRADAFCKEVPRAYEFKADA